MTVANGSDSITLPPSPCKEREREKEKRKAAPKINVLGIALTDFKLPNSVVEANLYSFTHPIHCLLTLERCPPVRCLHDE